MTLQKEPSYSFNIISYLDEMREISEIIPISIIFITLLLSIFIIFKALKKIKNNVRLNKNEFDESITKENTSPSFGRWITEPASTTTTNSINAKNRSQTKIGYVLLLCGSILVLSTFFTTTTLYL